MKITEIKEDNNCVSKKAKNEINKPSINWIAVLFYIYLHVFGILGLYVLFYKAKWMTLFYYLFLVIISSIALAAGAHRLYAHQTFVAVTQLRLFIVLTHTMAGVGSIYNWVFWHRVHHKFYKTEKDPYNHGKGFLYSHIISNVLSIPANMYKKEIDMRDVDEDGWIWIQRKFYYILFIVFGLLLPINIPVKYWDESIVNSLLTIGAARLLTTTNIAWLINSSLLVWGLKEGDKYPIDDNTVFFVIKSYWLNYHYLLPWDWKNDEFGRYNNGFMTFIIKIWYELGLINELKTSDTKDIREALYKVAISEMTIKEALEEVEQISKKNILNNKLIFHH